MQNVQDKFLIRVLNNKKYVINYYKVEKKLSDTEVSLLDESINLLLFNFMVSLDGGNDFSDIFDITIIDKATGEKVIDANKMALHERLFELDEDIFK